VFFPRHCGLDPQSPEKKEILNQVQNDGEKKVKISCIFAGSIIGSRYYASFHREGEQKVMAENIFSHNDQEKAVTMRIGTFFALSLRGFPLYYQQFIPST